MQLRMLHRERDASDALLHAVHPGMEAGPMIEEGDYRACIVHMPEIDWPCVRFLNSDGIQANIPINVLDRMMPALKDLLDRAFKPATCPFCDSTRLRTIPNDDEEPDWFVICDGCQATGPAGKDRAEAVAKWNRGVRRTNGVVD